MAMVPSTVTEKGVLYAMRMGHVYIARDGRTIIGRFS